MKAKFVTALVIALALILTSFSSTVVAQEEPTGTLRHAMNVALLTYDPHKDQRTISMTYLNPIFENLLTESMDGQSFEPQLAESWLEDTTGVTFFLREGVTFHDGTPFNAEAAVANFNRVKAEGHPALKGFIQNIESAEAIDDMTVRYNYSQFDATILLTLSRFAGKMVSPASFPPEGERITEPVGTGPWTLNLEETTEDNSLIVFDVYDGWWGGSTARPARIEINYFGSLPTQINALLAGDLDSSGFGGVANKQLLEANGMIVSGQLAVGWGALIQDRNGEKIPALADVRVRKAMQLAINNAAWAAAVDVGFPSVQYGTPETYAYSENISTSYDLEAAQTLMAEAGNPEFTVGLPGFGTFSARNAFLQSAWEPLGITVEEVSVSGAIFPACFSGDFSVIICPINEREVKHHIENRFLEGGSLNPYGVVNEEIEALYAQASSLPAESAEPIYTQIMEIADAEAITLWGVWAQVPVAYNPELVEGIEVRFFYPGVMKYENVRLK